MYRPIDIEFWQDDFILELTPEQKLIYIFLLTNRRTTQCGIYNISSTMTQVELKISEEMILQHLEFFKAKGKILYSEETKEIMLLNWYKYNNIHNHKNIRTCINKELKKVKTAEFINRFYEICKRVCTDQPELLREIFKDVVFRELPVDSDIEQEEPIGDIIYSAVEDDDGSKPQDSMEESSSEISMNKLSNTNGKVRDEIAADIKDSNKDEHLEKGKSGISTKNKVIECFKNNFHLPSYMEIEKLNSWVQDMGEPLVLKALEEAVYQNKRSLNYVSGILNNWLSEGIQTLHGAEEAINKYRTNKKSEAKKEDSSAKKLYSKNLAEEDFGGE
ncbi:DnaD domain protein [Clostridium sp.]|uniref:DnaD domain-containing protein n=1 Tax=Clostridium sp. TaxID=1506 RepID=UPI002FC7DFD5